MNNKSNNKNTSEDQVLQNDTINTKEQDQSTKSNITEIVDLREERIAELENTLVQIQKNERDNFLRAQAEIENVRRRSIQDMEKSRKFALEHFAIELLPVIDSLERTLEISDISNNILLTSLVEGIKLTLKSLLDVLHKFGINAIKDIGVTFDPKLHQAMSVLESEEYKKPNQVVKIMQKGYTLNDRLIRPAMVAVSKVKNDDISNS